MEKTLEAGLYIVATPIGNARDITLRALDVLKAADLILCEDTRVTSRLCAIHDIRTTLRPYHEHNAAIERPKIMAKIEEGASVALVSDAGTPLISDPGYKLVRTLLDEGLPVTTLPGASSVMAGLTLAGLPTNRFLFAGFLPPKQAARRSALVELRSIGATLVFLESPRRLSACLADMEGTLGDRSVSVAREMTKKFEQVRRGSISELAAQYAQEGAPKGEVVIIVGPPGAAEAVDEDSLDEMLHKALGAYSLKDAVAAVTDATGMKRRDVYARALEISRSED